MHPILSLIAACLIRNGLVSKTQLKKAVADLLLKPGRTALVVTALIVGLWGVGSIMVSTVILSNDLSINFLQTRPAQAVLISEEFESLDLAALRERPEIDGAELRGLSRERIEIAPNDWVPFYLFGVEDFRKIDLAQIYYESGDSAPSPGTILIERDCKKITKLRPGTTANIQTGGMVVPVPISGICFDPAQAPATQDHMVYGYTDKLTFKSITGQSSDTRLLVRFADVDDDREVQSAVKRLVARLESEGFAITKLEVPPFDAHPHQWELDALLYLQAALGFLAFLLGAVVVSQLMAAILSQQIRQIGVLRAVGASRTQILSIYLTMVLILGVVSGFVAIPLAIWSGLAYSEFVTTVINFELITTQLPLTVYVGLAAMSLLLPVLLSTPALLRGVRVPVREALVDYGIKQNGAVGRKVKSRPGLLSHTNTMAIRNVGRRKRRLIVTVTAMALGVAMFASGFNVRQSLANMLKEVERSRHYDVRVVFREPISSDRAINGFQSLQNLDRVEIWSGGKGKLQRPSASATEEVEVVAMPRDTELMEFEIVEGTWLSASASPEAVMSRRTLEKFQDVVVGEELVLEVDGKSFPVKLVGVLDEIGPKVLYMDQGDLDRTVGWGQKAKSIQFCAAERDYEQVIALKHEIERKIAAADLDVEGVETPAELVKIIYDHLNIILTVILFLAFLVLLVSALGMASAMGINVLERSREIGVLRAIGATTNTINRLLATEGLIISLAGYAIGILLSWPLSQHAYPFFGDLLFGAGGVLKSAFSHLGLIVTLVATLVFGWLATRLPARSAVSVSTREALAYE